MGFSFSFKLINCILFTAVLCLKSTAKHISELYHQDTMDYPSLSLKQDVIEKPLLGELKPSKSMYMKKYRREHKENRSIYAKKYLKKMKEKMLKNAVEEKCDHCDYKTINHLYMTDHKRINHSDTKQHCSECDYSHYYPNRVRQHFKRVHLGIKRKRHSRCQAGTNCGASSQQVRPRIISS